MARVSLEESWWTDPRRRALIKRVGSDEVADGCMVYAWRTSQEYWKDERRLIPFEIFRHLNRAREIVESGLALGLANDRLVDKVTGELLVDPESVDIESDAIREFDEIPFTAFVYVRGTAKRLDWAREFTEMQREKGRKSAESRRKKYGTAKPISIQSIEPDVNRGSSGSHEPMNRSEPSDSDSVSDSNNTKYNLVDSVESTRVRFDFESLYRLYPRKDGKTIGIRRCKTQIKTQKDFDELKAAITRYAEHCRAEGLEKRFIKLFSTFMGENKTQPWRDWLDPETGTAETSGSLSVLDEWAARRKNREAGQ